MKIETKDVLSFVKEFNDISPSDLENILEYLDDSGLLNEDGKEFRTILWELFIRKENDNIESLLNLSYTYNVSLDFARRPQDRKLPDIYVVGYSISVEELPGCSAYGYTLEEAYRNIKTSMRLWFEQAIKQNLPIPEPNKEKK